LNLKIKRRYIGNKIFQPIEIKLQKCGNAKLDKLFDEMEVNIKQSEDLRGKIAAHFKDMIVATGSCVLVHPTVERSISTFLICILIEINKDLEGDWKKIHDFDFKKLLTIDSKPPFVHMNEEKKQELKNDFKVDIEDNKEIMSAKDKIFSFVEAISTLKDFFSKLGEKYKILYAECLDTFNEIKAEYNSVGKEHITAGQAFDYINTAEKNVEKCLEISKMVEVMCDIFIEIANTVYTLAQKIMHPTEIAKWQRIASDAVKRKIFDPKEIVFTYAQEEKCKRIQDWEQNICYREAEEELKF